MKLQSSIDNLVIVKNGTDGTPGDNGYTHVKFSDDGGKTFTGNLGEDPGKYLGICTDNNEEDPNDVLAYKWVLVKGEDGKSTYSVILENENISFSTDQNRKPLSAQAYSCGILVFFGTTPRTDFAINEIKSVAGVSASIENKVIKLNVTPSTALPSDSGVIEVVITIDEQQITKQISYSLSKKGDAGSPTISATLSNEAHVFSADAAGNAIAFSSTTEVNAYKGTTQIVASIGTISGLPNGMTATITNNNTIAPVITFNVTSKLTTLNGLVGIPITANGVTINKQFSYALAKQGEDGTDGNDGSDAYTVYLSNQSYVFNADAKGNICKEISVETTVNAHKGNSAIAPTIGTLPTVDGLELNKNGATITIKALVGNALAEGGAFDIPVIVDGISYSLAFSYSKVKDGENFGYDDICTHESVDGLVVCKESQDACVYIDRLDGSSIQNNTAGLPNVDNPQEIHSVGDSGKLTVVSSVGGRNYIKDSDVTYELTNTTSYKTFNMLTTDSLNFNDFVTNPFTLSFYVKTPGTHKSISSGSTNARFGMHCTVIYVKSDGTTGLAYPFASKLFPFGKDERVSVTQSFTKPSDAVSISRVYFTVQLTEAPADDNNETWIFSRPKFELGSEATDWNPAPEDISSNNALDYSSYISKIELPLDEPLRSTQSYADRVCKKDGLYGIERQCVASAPITIPAGIIESGRKTRDLNISKVFPVKAYTWEPDMNLGHSTHFVSAYNQNDNEHFYVGNKNLGGSDSVRVYTEKEETIEGVVFTAVRMEPVFEPFDNKIQRALKNILSFKNNTYVYTVPGYNEPIPQFSCSFKTESFYENSKLSQSIEDVHDGLNNFQDTIETTFRDGIIEASEAKAIKQYINIIQTDKVQLDKDYSSIYNNTALSGTAKTNLANAKNDYEAKYTALINAVNTAISDDKATESEVITVNTAFTNYKTSIGMLRQRIQEALDFISSAKVNNIEIGGRNLAEKTNQGATNWGWSMQTGDRTTVEFIENGIRCCKFTRGTIEMAGWSVIYYNDIGRHKLEAGGQYTISFEVKGSVSTSFAAMFRNPGGQNELTQTVQPTFARTVANQWSKCKYVVTLKDTLPTATDQVLYLTSMNSGTGISYIFRNLKIEKGNKVTDWTPAPEDVQDHIDSITIGGQNLILDSTGNLNKYWTNPAVSIVQGGGLNSNNCINVHRSNFTGTDRLNYGNGHITLPDTTLGTTYTLSAWIKIHSNITLDIPHQSGVFLRFSNSAGTSTQDMTLYLTANTPKDKWIYYSTTAKLKSSQYTAQPYVAVVLGKNGNISACNIKLEKGTKATDWSPAPEDVQNQIDETTSLLNDLVSDSKLTPNEKVIAKKEWLIIADEYPKYITQASEYKVSTTAYTNAYNALNTYLNATNDGVIFDMGTTTDISSSIFTSTFKTYYNCKVDLINAITAAKAKYEAENVQVGTRNLLLGTDVPNVVAQTEELVAVSKNKQYYFSSLIRSNPKKFLLDNKNLRLLLSYDIEVEEIWYDPSLTQNRCGVYFTFIFVNKEDGTEKYWYGTHTGPSHPTYRHTAPSTNSLYYYSSEDPNRLVYHYACYVTPDTEPIKSFYENPDKYDVMANYATCEIRGKTKGGKISNVSLTLSTIPTDWIPAQEDIATSINGVQNNLNEFTNTVNGAFKDGIIQTNEAIAIKQNLNIIQTDKAQLDKEYTSVNDNALLSGTAKTNLASAKIDYDNKYNSLINAITNAISDGKTTTTEATIVNTAFTNYRNSIGILRQRIQEALDYVGTQKVNNIEVGGRNLLTKSNRRKDNPFIVTGNSEDIYYSPLNLGLGMVLVEPGQTYTIQCKTDGTWTDYHGGSNRDPINKDCTLWLYVRYKDSSKPYGSYDAAIALLRSYNYSSKNNTGLATWIWTAPSNAHDIGIRLNGYSNGTDTITVNMWDLKIEKGNKVTDWTPAVEDVQDQLDNAISTVYSMLVSSYVIAKSTSGSYTPSTITLTSKSKTGTADIEDYACRFKIEETADMSTWTVKYTSSADETSKIYTPSAGIKALRCAMYLAGGTTTLLDQQVIPVVSDGKTGLDAYTILLSNESHSFSGSTNSALAGNTVCKVIAYKGSTQVAATIGTISGCPTGMTTSIANNGTTSAQFTVAVTTAMTTTNGTLSVPITVDGKSFTKTFSYSLSLKGAGGVDAKSIDITASSLVFKSTDGGLTFAPDNIKLTPIFQGGISYSKWQYSTNGGTTWTDITSGSHGLTISSGVLTVAKTSDLFTSTITSISFKCISNNVSYYDIITISQLTDITDVEIGMRNIALNTRTLPANQEYINGATNTKDLIDDLSVPSRKALKITFTPTKVNVTSGFYYRYSGIIGSLDRLVENETYTISVWMKCDTLGIKMLPSSLCESQTLISYSDNWSDGTTAEWQRYSITFKFTAINKFTSCFYFIFSELSNYTFYISSYSLVRGTIATDWSPAPEDIDMSIDTVKDSLDSFQTTVTGSFKDGIIEESEASAIKQNLNIIQTDKAQLDKDYSSVYGNTILAGTAKTNLANAKTDYDSKYTSLVNTINSAIADGKATAAESTAVNTAFVQYKTSIGTLRQRLQEALDFIGTTKVNNVSVGGRNLFADTGRKISNNGYLFARYVPASDPLIPGEVYTATICVTPAPGVTQFRLHFSYGYDGAVASFIINGQERQIISKTFTMRYSSGYTPDDDIKNSYAMYYRLPNDNTVTENSTMHWMKIEKGNKATDWTPAPEDIQDAIDGVNKNTVELIVGTQTAATGTWTGRASSFSSLKDGQQITYWLPYNGSGNATLNLTLKDGSSTGAINCYYNGTTRITTHYPAGNSIRLTYRENISIGGSSTKYTGWWADASYNTDTFDRIRHNNSIKAKTAISVYHLIVGDDSGYFHLASSTAFDITKLILYAGNSISASSSGTNNYISFPSVNLANNKPGWTGTTGKTCYLVGSLLGKTFTPNSTLFTTTEPTTDDGLVYIALGYMASTTQIYLYPEHPMYRFVGDKFMSFAEIAYDAQITATDTKNDMVTVKSDIDDINKSITDEVWKKSLVEVKDSQGEIVKKQLEDLLIQHNVSLEGINQSVSSYVADLLDNKFDEYDEAIREHVSDSISDTVTKHITGETSEVKQTADEIKNVVGKNMFERVNVRYIRDWLFGNNNDKENRFVECKVLTSSGTNLANGLTARAYKSDLTEVTGVANLSYYTDELVNNYVYNADVSMLQLDLGSTRADVEAIQIFHYFEDGRKYTTKLEISEDGTNWITVYDSDIDGQYIETEDGATHKIQNEALADQLSFIKQTLKTINLTVQENEDNYSSIVSSVNSISQRVEKTEDGITTVINQVADVNKEWKVSMKKIGAYKGDDVPDQETCISLDPTGFYIQSPNKKGRKTQITAETFMGIFNEGLSDSEDVIVFSLDKDCVYTHKLDAPGGANFRTMRLIPITYKDSGNKAHGGVALVKGTQSN